MKRILWLILFLSFSLFVIFLVSQTLETEKATVGHFRAPDHQHGASPTSSHSQEISSEVSSSATAVANKEVQKSYPPRFSHGLIQAEQKSHPPRFSYGIIQKAFAEAIALKDTNFELAQEEIHAVAAALGGSDPNWAEYLHLRGHSLLDGYLELESGLRFFELERELFGETEALQKAIEDTRLKIKWNEEIPQMKYLTQPIQDLRAWIKENAPSESKIVEKHYLETLKKRETEPIDLTEKWMTPQDRADVRYKTFFEALAILPEDSLTLRVFFESDITDAQEILQSEQAARQTAPPPLPKPQQTPLHTWDMEHFTTEDSVSISDANKHSTTEGMDRVSEATVASKPLLVSMSSKEEDFNLTLRNSVQRFGPEEGLRRVSAISPEWAQKIREQFSTQEALTEWMNHQSATPQEASRQGTTPSNE